MKKRVYNGTGGTVKTVEDYLFDPHASIFIGGMITKVFLSDPKLNHCMSTTKVEEIDGIPIFQTKTGKVDDLPGDYDMYIVNEEFARDYRLTGSETAKLFTVSEPVYNVDGSIKGTIGLEKVY